MTMTAKNLIIGLRWNDQSGTQDAVALADHPPVGWIWWKRIHKRIRPTWLEWEMCWRNLSGMQNMDVPIHQSMRLLQHHGPQRLRQAWGWVAILLSQGQPLHDAMQAVFRLPSVWLPLFQSATVNASFLASLATFCEKKKNQQQSMRKNLRYPLVMSFLIMALGIVSTLDVIPHAAPRTSSSYWPAWLPYALWGVPFVLGLYVWHRLLRRHTPFFRFLELALKAGHTEHEAIHHFCHMNPKSELKLVHQRLQQGVSFSESLRDVWPDAIVDLITLNASRLDVIVGNIADMVEADEQELTERWLSWAQASLIVAMGLMVFWMAWTTLMPLYDSIGRF